MTTTADVTCKNCGGPIAECRLEELPGDQPCYYHAGHGWHRCDGKPQDASGAPLAEPQAVTT